MACLIFGAGSFYGLPRSVEAGDIVIAADGGTGIHVGNKAKGFALAGEIAVNIAIGILLHIGKTDGFELLGKRCAQRKLTGGGGTAFTLFIAVSGIADIS